MNEDTQSLHCRLEKDKLAEEAKEDESPEGKT